MGELRKLAAIMFSDIVGYSDIMSQDEKHALKIIEQSRKIHKAAISNFKGEFIKDIGDTTLASFHSALNAVSCAVSIQQQLKDNPDIYIRIGIHIGDVVVKGDDVFGDSVNISSKIKTITDAGHICISEHVYNYIYNIPGIEVELLGEKELKGLKQPIKIYTLNYDKFPEELIASDSITDISVSRIFFWQELKRRKVIKVATMYIAGAFGILEAFDILFPNIFYPVWLIIILILFVIAGFAGSVYLAWIYEFTSDGLLKTETIGVVTGQENKFPQTSKTWVRLSNLIIAVLVILIGVLIYPKIFAKDKFKEIKNDDGRISIAVMPFKNLSGDTTYNIWQEGFQNLLINTLTESKELSIRQFNTIYSAIGNNKEINYKSLTPSVASDITLKLKSKSFIQGNILKAGDKIRINAQLLNAETEEIYKTYQIDGQTEDDIFEIVDSLSRNIKNYFEIKVIIDEFGYSENYVMTNQASAEALRYFILGMGSFINLDYTTAIDWYSKAIEVDSNFVSAYFYLSMTYNNLGYADEAIHWFNLAYQKRERLPLIEKLELDWFKSFYFETPIEQIKYIKQILEIEDQSVMYWYVLGLAYYRLEQYEEVIFPLEKTLEICQNLSIKHHWVYTYTGLGRAYHYTGNHIKEKEIYELGLSVLPENPDIYWCQAVCAISLGEENKAKEYLSYYELIREEKNGYSKADILSDFGEIYEKANKPDSAEKYHRLALALEPSNPDFMYYLAWNLIDNNINLDEGMALIDKALEIDPNNYLYIDTKGWGLFKNEHFNEALEKLNSAWDNRPHYEHRLYKHIKEVKEILQKEKIPT